MSVTYTVTEADGFTHTRTSAGHVEPIYTHAVVREPHGGKASVAYCSRLDLAQAQLAQALKARWGWSDRKGELAYPDAKIYPVAATVKRPKA